MLRYNGPYISIFVLNVWRPSIIFWVNLDLINHNTELNNLVFLVLTLNRYLPVGYLYLLTIICIYLPLLTLNRSAVRNFDDAVAWIDSLMHAPKVWNNNISDNVSFNTHKELFIPEKFGNEHLRLSQTLKLIKGTL